jgi:hypothetical protein
MSIGNAGNLMGNERQAGMASLDGVRWPVSAPFACFFGPF